MNEHLLVPDIDAHDVSEHARLFDLNEIIIRILHGRGHDTSEKIEDFLYPRLTGAHSPFRMDGMYDAVALIKKAVESDWKIGIFADSDLDGITSMSVIHLLLSRMKKDAFIRYLKNDENYGLTNKIIDEFHSNGVRLMITVDSGTRDIDEISYARSLGMDVLVTDHHEQESGLPDALVINPKKTGCGYPFKHLAGVGVALKVCIALLMSYLPSFNKYFMLIIEAEIGYMFSVIRNGSVEETISVPDYDGIVDSICRFDNCFAILVYEDMALVSMLSEIFSEIKVFDIRDFIIRVVKTDISGIDHFIKSSSARQMADHEKLSCITSIFLDAQLSGSEKISDFINASLGLVAIGSVADVIPLIGENRLLVKRGIDILNKQGHRSIALLLNGEQINSRTIGWSIAPLLNTPGRIGRTELTARFFLESDRTALKKIISEIRTLNEERRSFINDFCATTIRELSLVSADNSERLIFIKTDRIPDGYAGLVANRISDETGKPTIVAVMPGKHGVIKGSGRSRSGGIFFSTVERFHDRFDRIGGHENAFGFTVRVEDIDEIIGLIKNAMDGLSTPETAPAIDCKIDPAQITSGFIAQLSRLEPFGAGNEEPLFISQNVIFKSFMAFGKNHGKFIPEGESGVTAIGWNMGVIMKNFFESGKPLDVVYRLENNSFNGSVSPRMIIHSIRYTGLSVP